MEKKRIYLFDNVKFILILLVVIGHIIDPVIEKSMFFKNIFTYIYLFHMPLFIFIFGYFSKSFFKNGQTKSYKIIQFAILYITLTFSEMLLSWGMTGITPKLHILSTGGIPWYLLASILWLLTIPFINKFKPKYVIGFSILFGVLVGIDRTIVDFLASSRFFVFYPFFIVGYLMNKKTLENILNKNNTIFSILILLILGFIIFNNDIPTYQFRGLLTGRNPYDVMNFGYLGVVYRLIYYVIVFLVMGAILNLAPRGKYFFTKFGERTLQVYFLHDLVFIALINSTFYSFFIQNIPYWKISLLLFSCLLTFFLSLKIFEYPFKWLNNCQFKWLNKNYTDKV